MAHIGNEAKQDLVAFVVKFDPADLNKVKNNPSDIHVFDSSVQPTILGFTRIPAGFKLA